MSLSELDPDYGNHDALLAYARGDTPPNKDGVRLVTPTDHRGRAVDDVVKIEVD